MSAKNVDKHNRFRSITVGFRVSPEEQEVVYALHKILSGNKAEDMLEDVLKLFVRTKNNKEFIYYVKKSLLRK